MSLQSLSICCPIGDRHSFRKFPQICVPLRLSASTHRGRCNGGPCAGNRPSKSTLRFACPAHTCLLGVEMRFVSMLLSMKNRTLQPTTVMSARDRDHYEYGIIRQRSCRGRIHVVFDLFRELNDCKPKMLWAATYVLRFRRRHL